MMLALHEMDHLPDDILNCGPPTALHGGGCTKGHLAIVSLLAAREYSYSTRTAQSGADEIP